MARSAQLYRMVTDEHICPFGLKSKDLLEREGFDVEDHPLESREETDRFMEKHDVDTTPQTFIDGKRVGGYESLLEYFGKDVSKGDETTYTPVIATFSVTFLMALGLTWSQGDGFWLVTLIEWFIAISMCALAIQKLKDPEAFLNQFITYDLLAMKKLRYAYVYPVLEAFAGIGMLAALPAWLVSPPAFFIGTVGAVSVYKAVYIDKRELKCACVGGDSNVPLGFISLTENLMMVAMAIWMWVR